MDFNVAIDRNRDALLRIVMMLFAMAGIARGGVVERLPRRVRSVIVRTLRAGEAACRRLVVVQASLMTVEAGPKRAAPSEPIPRGKGTAGRLPCFPLFDKRKHFGVRRGRVGAGARITSVGYIDPIFSPPKPDLTPEDLLSAARLCGRMEALARALEALPKQAKRLLRMQEQRKHAPPGPRRVGPIRPGWPPGYRQRHKDPVDGVLYHCHVFALRALNPPRRIGTDKVAA